MVDPIEIRTIGDLADHGYVLTAHCRACSRIGDVDLEALARRIGRDTVYVGRRLPLVCAACGSRDVAVTIGPAARPASSAPGWIAPPTPKTRKP